MSIIKKHIKNVKNTLLTLGYILLVFIFICFICFILIYKDLAIEVKKIRDPVRHLDEIGERIGLIIEGERPENSFFQLRRNGHWDVEQGKDGEKYIIDKDGNNIYFNKHPLTYSLIKKLCNKKEKYHSFTVTNVGKDGVIGTIDDIIFKFKQNNKGLFCEGGIRLDIHDDHSSVVGGKP